jgi:hypothetical protein
MFLSNKPLNFKFCAYIVSKKTEKISEKYINSDMYIHVLDYIRVFYHVSYILQYIEACFI